MCSLGDSFRQSYILVVDSVQHQVHNSGAFVCNRDPDNVIKFSVGNASQLASTPTRLQADIALTVFLVLRVVVPMAGKNCVRTI